MDYNSDFSYPFVPLKEPLKFEFSKAVIDNLRFPKILEILLNQYNKQTNKQLPSIIVNAAVATNFIAVVVAIFTASRVSSMPTTAASSLPGEHHYHHLQHHHYHQNPAATTCTANSRNTSGTQIGPCLFLVRSFSLIVDHVLCLCLICSDSLIVALQFLSV